MTVALPRCQYCGNTFLTEQARDWHEPKCADNPDTQSTVEDE